MADRHDRQDIAARANPYDVFWDPQYTGKLAVIDDFHTTMGMVLLRDGIDDLNTTNPDDIALMRTDLLALYKETKPAVTVSMYTDLPAGQIGLSEMWSGDIVNAQYYLPKGQSSDILRYWFPEDGRGMVDNDLMVVLAQDRTRSRRTTSSTTCSTTRPRSRTSVSPATSPR